MIARVGSGWEAVLADLALILFMVTAVALSQAGEGAQAQAQSVPLSPQGEAMAFYRADPGAPAIDQWLDSQSADARQQLTIVAQYRPGHQEDALRQAEKLAREAQAAGAQARIVVEPGEGGTTATLAFDVPDATLARSLQEKSRTEDKLEDRP